MLWVINALPLPVECVLHVFLEGLSDVKKTLAALDGENWFVADLVCKFATTLQRATLFGNIDEEIEVVGDLSSNVKSGQDVFFRLALTDQPGEKPSTAIAGG